MYNFSFIPLSTVPFLLSNVLHLFSSFTTLFSILYSLSFTLHPSLLTLHHTFTFSISFECLLFIVCYLLFFNQDHDLDVPHQH